MTPGGGAGAFADQMAAVTACGDRPGRYHAEIAAHWSSPFVPHGGLMAAVAARAMATELAAPDQLLRTLTTVFAQPVPVGPVTVDVGVVRRGRSLSQATATVAPAGAEPPVGHTTLAVFGRSRPGFAFTDRALPDVPGPADSLSIPDARPPGFEDPGIEFWNHVETRIALGHLAWDDYEPVTSDCAVWYRFGEPPRGDDGMLDPLALVMLCDTMPTSVGERLGPGPRDWWTPSADLTVHVLGESRAEWLLAHLRAQHAGDGYASTEIALWDPDAGLVAYGTQMLFFTFPGR